MYLLLIVFWCECTIVELRVLLLFHIPNIHHGVMHGARPEWSACVALSARGTKQMVRDPWHLEAVRWCCGVIGWTINNSFSILNLIIYSSSKQDTIQGSSASSLFVLLQTEICEKQSPTPVLQNPLSYSYRYATILYKALAL